jgi:hypothetical protein
MSIISRFCRILLIAHGLMDVAQGIYGLALPQEYGQMAGDRFAGSSDQALQSIGDFSIFRSQPSDQCSLYRTRFNWRRLVSVGVRVPKQPHAYSCYDPDETVLRNRDMELGQ